MPLIKTQSGLSHGLPSKGVQLHLQAKLKREWRYNPGKGAFYDLSGKHKGHIAPRRLPSGSQVAPMVPALAEADPRKLSRDELKLARFVLIMLPKGANPEKILKEMLDWHFVESAELPPSVSLP